MAESPLLRDGASFLLQSASGSTYSLKNVGGVYSCSCASWRNQSRDPNYRSCKHLVQYRGAQDEALRINPGGWENMPSTTERLLLRFRPVTTRTTAPSPAAVLSYLKVPARAEAATRVVLQRCSICFSDSHNASTCTVSTSNPTMSVRPGNHVITMTKAKAPTKVGVDKNGHPHPPTAPEPVHNAWTALMDDNSPLNEDDDKLPVVEVPQAVVPVSDEEESESEDSEGKLSVLLAHPWDWVSDPTGYMMSEKLDGVRAYWDGTNFRSRLDNVFAVPDWYLEGMPKEHLDGEFWMERGKFQETSGLVRRQDKSDLWRKIRYMVFDAPNAGGGFESRYLAIGSNILLNRHCERLNHLSCHSLADLQSELRHVEELGGEGLMLREPGSLYVRGRSTSLLKVKTFFDSEATVVGFRAGKGKHRGKIGALRVTIPETVQLTSGDGVRSGRKTCTLRRGVEFDVGTGLSDAQRASGPTGIQVGASITFRFQELTKKGIPRFPSFIGLRNYE